MIFVEGSTDDFLFEILGIAKRNRTQAGNNVEVLKQLEKTNGNVLGVIDEDPGKTHPTQWNNYKISEKKGSVSLFIKKDDGSKRVIVISPYLEEWLLNRAKRNKIDPKDYGLSNDPHRLHGLNIRRNKKYQEFVKALIELNQEVSAIKEWLREIILLS